MGEIEACIGWQVHRNLPGNGYADERFLGPRVRLRQEPEQELLPGVVKIRKLAETRMSPSKTNLCWFFVPVQIKLLFWNKCASKNLGIFAIWINEEIFIRIHIPWSFKYLISAGLKNHGITLDILKISCRSWTSLHWCLWFVIGNQTELQIFK